MTVHPNFFLVGAARAGTTSLWQYLKAHPHVHMPSSLQGKEPSYFCDLTPPWARTCRTLDAYLELFKGGHRARAVGDASTNYLVAPESAGRIQRQYPDAKILMILRNPAERAFSIYRAMCSWGLETATTFEKALRREPQRRTSERFRNERELLYYAYLYVESGRFSRQIQRYLDHFPRQRIHIVLNDDLRHAGLETVREMYRFLDVDPDFEPEIQAHNVSQFPCSVRFQAAIASRWHAHPLTPREPIRRRDRLHFPVAFAINTVLGEYRKVRMRPETRRALLDEFRQDIEATSVLIGRDLSSWLKDRPAAAPPQPAVVQAG